jgi:hypothetical protein
LSGAFSSVRAPRISVLKKNEATLRGIGPSSKENLVLLLSQCEFGCSLSDFMYFGTYNSEITTNNLSLDSGLDTRFFKISETYVIEQIIFYTG